MFSRSQRPFAVAVESRLPLMVGAWVAGTASPFALSSTVFGWSGIWAISFFASSQASRFYYKTQFNFMSGSRQMKTQKQTFLHQSRWLRAMLMAISRRSATFCLWNRSRSAWMVELEYFKSCADRCKASSSCRHIWSAQNARFCSYCPLNSNSPVRWSHASCWLNFDGQSQDPRPSYHVVYKWVRW